MSSGDPRYRNKSAEKTLMTFERQILRKIFGPVLEDNRWRMRSNVELEKLHTDINIPAFVKLQRGIQNGWMMQENN